MVPIFDTSIVQKLNMDNTPLHQSEILTYQRVTVPNYMIAASILSLCIVRFMHHTFEPLVFPKVVHYCLSIYG